MTALQPGASLKVPYSPLPCGDSKSIRFDMDFAATDSFEIDFTLSIQQKQIDSLQSVFIDNTQNASDFSVVTGALGQRLTVPAGGMAYLPIIAPNPAKLTCTASAGGSNLTTMIVNNFPTPTIVWIP